MRYDLEVGDFVTYNGEVIERSFVWKSLYKCLNIGKSYRIKQIFKDGNKIYYRIYVDTKEYSFPKEAFYNKYEIGKKYGLI